MPQPFHCQIRVAGKLPSQWAGWFAGLDMVARPDGQTMLSGWLPDQAALRGVLDHIFDLNLQLLSVSQGLEETATQSE